MNATIRKQIKALEKMRLPELQARYAEVLGEETRAPNRKFLIRKITEALQARGDDAPAEATPLEAEAQPAAEANAAPATEPAQQPDDEGTGDDAGGDETRLSKLSVPDLQAKYREVVGRDTGSSHKRYLIWKIRQAQQGKVPVGPVGRRQPGEPPVEHKVLPLRMPAETVEALDDVWRRRGLKSRMDLFRHALDQYLTGLGEEAAATRVRSA